MSLLQKITDEVVCFIGYFFRIPPLNIRYDSLPYDLAVPIKFNASRMEAHFLQGYIPDIVLIFLAIEIFACQVVEKHRDAYAVAAG